MSSSSAPKPAAPADGSPNYSTKGAEVGDLVLRTMRIGAGSFATVYTSTSQFNQAIKLVADVSRTQELEQEFDHLERIYKPFGCNMFFKLPKPVGYHPSFHEYAHVHRIPCDRIPDNPIYIMGRLHPVPALLAKEIIEQYFPEQHQASCRDKLFICRLYFGPSRPSTGRFFNHHNFPLTTSMMEQLRLPLEDIADGMGRMLSCLHHRAHLDGRDIEFVLGGDIDGEEHQYWCIDFNQMRAWSQVDQLVDSFYINDPYYPRPGMPYWDAFKAGYLSAAPDGEPAQQFLDAVEARAAAGSPLPRPLV